MKCEGQVSPSKSIIVYNALHWVYVLLKQTRDGQRKITLRSLRPIFLTSAVRLLQSDRAAV